MRWFDLSFAPMKQVLRTICALVSLEASTTVSPDFCPSHGAFTIFPVPTLCSYSNHFLNHGIYTHSHSHSHSHSHIHLHKHKHKHKHIYVYTYTAPDITQKTETGDTEELNSEGNEKRRRQRESRVNSGVEKKSPVTNIDKKKNGARVWHG